MLFIKGFVGMPPVFSYPHRDFSHLGLAQEISGFLVLILGFCCYLICDDDFQQLF